VRILIYGAGSTGCYLAARCIQAGLEVVLIGRQRVQKELTAEGKISVGDFESNNFSAAPPTFKTQLNELDFVDRPFDVCLVTLKCHHLSSAAEDLNALAATSCELHFLQNGINAYRACPALAQLDNSYSGIIPFNVLSQGYAHFHQGTEGALQLAQTPRTNELAIAFKHAGLEILLYENIQPVIYGKLLLNLNNAINAISDIPLKAQLENKALRKTLAEAMQEYINLCKRRQIQLSTPSPLPPKALPYILKLPNFLFVRLAKKLLMIDPLARSSMWEDIQAGRKTEIDYLNAWVAQECAKEGIPSPVNAAITQKIRKLES